MLLAKPHSTIGSSHNLFSTTAYFRPPKTLPYKNIDGLNFAAIGVSLFSAGLAVLDSVFLLLLKFSGNYLMTLCWKTLFSSAFSYYQNFWLFPWLRFLMS